MRLPLPFTADAISLGYGAVDDEFYTRYSPHQGIDFSSRSRGIGAGTPIRASGAGTVTRSGVGPAGVSPNMWRPNDKAGNSIDVDYGPFIARYMHRPWDSPSPAEGAAVIEGTSLGVIGGTGLTDFPHLHLETWDKATGRRVDPANFFDFNRVVSEDDNMPTLQEIFNYQVPKYDAAGKQIGTTTLAAVLGWSDANNDSVLKATIAGIMDAQITRQGLPASDQLAGKPTTIRALAAWSDANFQAVHNSVKQSVLDAIKTLPAGPGGSVNVDAVAEKVAEVFAEKLAKPLPSA